jgi:hypothetical protein
MISFQTVFLISWECCNLEVNFGVPRSWRGVLSASSRHHPQKDGLVREWL